MKKLIDPSKVAYGNKIDEDDLYISPTILKNVSPDDAVMQEEIFGPLLPIITLKNLDEAISFVQDHEKPLALYIFSNVQKSIDRVLKMTSAGSVCVNDAVVQGAGSLTFHSLYCIPYITPYISLPYITETIIHFNFPVKAKIFILRQFLSLTLSLIIS